MRKDSKVLHEPRMDTILMVEKAIIEAKNYPRRMELYYSLPKKPQYQTFMRILDYLEAHGQIIFDSKRIRYTGVNNEKLEALIKSSVSAKEIL